MDSNTLQKVTLNPRQQEAVLHTEGPLLILAGAGSGKTRVLTHRAAYLISQGVKPWNILAITFTNKAAAEMRERIDQIVGMGSDSVWVSTFHSLCVRILRRFIDRMGFDPSFSIYDADDQKSVMKDVCKKLEIDTKLTKERTLLAAISRAKDELVSPAEMALNAGNDFYARRTAEAYQEYQAQLRRNNALDFDDLIMKTVELFQNCPEVLDHYQERFRYIMVDEYQDTNTAQFRLVSLLASKYRNLCVVGDDDQSIYRFRGANIRNILDFEKVFPDAKVIKLEQNYRSTANILNAANDVIRNNAGRKDKRLWTENGDGAPVHLRQFQNGFEEAEYIIGNIRSHIEKGEAEYKDHAILYRTNAQSRLFEEKLIYANIPYKLIGGVNFYARKEIKDLLAYLKTIDNGRDELAVRRIINVPKRGIGATTLARVSDYAAAYGISFYDALLRADEIPGIGRGSAKVLPFTVLIQTLRAKQGQISVSELLEAVIEETGYVKELELEATEEARARIENIDELISKVRDYDENAENPSLKRLSGGGRPGGGYRQSGGRKQPGGADDPSQRQGAGIPLRLYGGHGRRTVSQLHVHHGRQSQGGNRGGKTPLLRGYHPGEKGADADGGETAHGPGRDTVQSGIPFYPGDSARSTWTKRANHQESAPRKNGRNAKEKRREAFLEARQDFRAKPFETAPVTVTKADHLEYGVGDRVRHLRFGEGTVLEITEGRKDYEVRVNFDTAGVKKLFASFAKLKKI